MIIIVLLLQISMMKKLSYRNIVHSIDCGNYMKYRSFDGIKYKNDQFFLGSSEVIDYYDEQKPVKVQQTLDQELYLTQRQGQHFSYQLPLKNEVPEIQNYILTLNFAELQYQESNIRIFEVYLGNKLVIKNLDIYQKVGIRTAYTLDISFQKVGQQVLYQGEQIHGAIRKNNELLIRFKSIKNKATIAGLMLKIGDNQVEEVDMSNPKNTLKAMNRYKKLTDESMKIIEQEVIEIQKDLKNNDEIQYSDAHNRKNTIKEIKLFQFSYKLLRLLIQSPFGIVLASSFLGICLITLLKLFCQNQQKFIEFNKIKNSKLD